MFSIHLTLRQVGDRRNLYSVVITPPQSTQASIAPILTRASFLSACRRQMCVLVLECSRSSSLTIGTLHNVHASSIRLVESLSSQQVDPRNSRVVPPADWIVLVSVVSLSRSFVFRTLHSCRWNLASSILNSRWIFGRLDLDWCPNSSILLTTPERPHSDPIRPQI